MRYLIVFLIVILPFTALAQELKSKDDVRTFSESIMGKVARGEIIEGLQLLKTHFPIPSSEFEVMVEKFRLQAPAIKQRFGDTVGVELIRERELGQSLMMIHYVQKFEKTVMNWRFYFYRPKTTWIVSTFFTDDQLQDTFK